MENILYNFDMIGNQNDGGYFPYSNLIYYNNVFFGTTSGGGVNDKGTIFFIDTLGNFQTLYDFGSVGNINDGSAPYAGLLEFNGILYGTTSSGGNYNSGTIFSINPNGIMGNYFDYTTLYSFGHDGMFDGCIPYASLILCNNLLFGTTINGGDNNKGTIFSIKLDGKNYRRLYSFGTVGGSTDGAVPYASLLLYYDMLYGITYNGGNNNYGTIFRLDPNGISSNNYNYNTLYRFGSIQADGIRPYASFLLLNDLFYGTTQNGGLHNIGTIFTFDPNGDPSNEYNYEIIYNFGTVRTGNLNDGANPCCTLTLYDNLLYGTTLNTDTFTSGHGTIFSIDPYGVSANNYSYATIYRFNGYDMNGGSDGSSPKSSLTLLNNTLYGNTVIGGSNNYGTIFSYQPPVICFNKGTLILYLNPETNNYEYKAIEELKAGDFVKVYNANGEDTFKSISLIGYGKFKNNKNSWSNSMYLYPSHNLMVTGRHSILVDNLTKEEKEKSKEYFADIDYKIEDKYLLIAAASNKFIRMTDNNIYTYYHMVLDSDKDERFGIWANGILTETTHKKNFSKNLNIISSIENDDSNLKNNIIKILNNSKISKNIESVTIEPVEQNNISIHNNNNNNNNNNIIKNKKNKNKKSWNIINNM
jgi:uncharacterized repeat protein (TIGR03803 family)